MNKESLGLYLLRLFLNSVLVISVGMLYWSSLLTEERLNAIYQEVLDLKKGLSTYRHTNSQTNSANHTITSEPLTKTISHIDDSLPNLLVEDPFYSKTLPEILEKDFAPKGYFQEASVGRPTNLHPFNNWSNVSSWHNQCSVSLAQLAFGSYRIWTPNMATKIEARQRKDYDSPEAIEFWVHLRNDVYWQPIKPQFFSEDIALAPIFQEKHPVNAYDFAFYYHVVMNSHVEEPGALAARSLYQDIESMTILDPQTLVVRWKVHEVIDSSGKKNYKIKHIASSLTGSLVPLPSHVFQHFADGSSILEPETPLENYQTSAVWAQNFSEHWARNIIVSCGPWIFDGMNEREIKFIRNPDHFQPLQVLVEGSFTQFKEAPEPIWQSFKGNKIDSYILQPTQLIELSNFLKSDQYLQQQRDGAGIRRLEYPSQAYAYIAWNQARPYFSSQKVRQALTMAIDRKRIIKQNLNGLGIEINGTFYRYSTSYDESIEPWPYDPLKARRLLEEEGWHESDGSGIINKLIDGKQVPFRFTLNYYVKNPVSKSISEYISTSLKDLGIDCILNGVDLPDLSVAFEDKNFDAQYMGWALSIPPEDPWQVWHSSGAFEKGSSNAIGFVNTEADTLIEALQYESDPVERQKLYFRFDAIIHETAPYTFLYSPKVIFLYRDSLQNVFIPKDNQKLIPGADAGEPNSQAFWLKTRTRALTF